MRNVGNEVRLNTRLDDVRVMLRDVKSFYYLLFPRPVVLVVTCSKEGRVNVMAASWVTPIAEDEPTLGVAIDRSHFTRQLLDEVPEFTVNVPGVDLLDKVWKAGTVSGREVDKAKILGLTFRPAKKVRPPVIEECIGALEAQVYKIIPVGEVDFVIGRVVAAYVKEEYLYKGEYINFRKAKVLLHAGGRAFMYPAPEMLFPKE